MNLSFISNLIKQYKEWFSKIHKEEIYKWAAVQYFQEDWDIDQPDFQTMMDNVLSKAKNLLYSGSYYLKRMLKDIMARSNKAYAC